MEELEKFNNFKEYKDITKYILTNNSEDRVVSFIRIMEFDDVGKTVEALNFLIDIEKHIETKIVDTLKSTTFMMIHVPADPEDQTEGFEIAIQLQVRMVNIKEDDIFPLNKESIHNVIYQEIGTYDIQEINNFTDKPDDYAEKKILDISGRGIIDFFSIRDISIYYDMDTYRPIQLMIYKIFLKDGELYFNGTVCFDRSMLEKFVLRTI